MSDLEKDSRDREERDRRADSLLAAMLAPLPASEHASLLADAAELAGLAAIAYHDTSLEQARRFQASLDGVRLEAQPVQTVELLREKLRERGVIPERDQEAVRRADQGPWRPDAKQPTEGSRILFKLRTDEPIEVTDWIPGVFLLTVGLPRFYNEAGKGFLDDAVALWKYEEVADAR